MMCVCVCVHACVWVHAGRCACVWKCECESVCYTILTYTNPAPCPSCAQCPTTRTRTRTRTLRYIRTCIWVKIHTRMYMHTRTHTCTQARTHTYIHLRTHAMSPVPPPPWVLWSLINISSSMKTRRPLLLSAWPLGVPTSRPVSNCIVNFCVCGSGLHKRWHGTFTFVTHVHVRHGIYTYISYTHLRMQKCTCDRIYVYIYKDTQHTCKSSPQK